MNAVFHLPRTLVAGDRRLSEEDLLAQTAPVVVLAEPGGGKTSLLAALARRLGAEAVKASGFDPEEAGPCVIVDALDEVSRLRGHDLSPLLKEIRSARPARVILASRSGEWEAADRHKVEAVFRAVPLVVHLLPMDTDAQAALFAHAFPGEDFTCFLREIDRFDLRHLLGNPEFLKLFAAAYVEGGRSFRDRHAIFEDAVRHLAQETNRAVPQRDAPTREQKIAWAEEVFAKLLLSGADRVAIAGGPEERRFPVLASLGVETRDLQAILDTRLFKPAQGEGRHEPVHRIVAEFGAARHLNRLIDDPAHLFTARQCLAVVAPNGVVREELRGLLGWLAALGSQDVQDRAIGIDAYAVLANGDPSRLSAGSKVRLIEALVALERVDPYFQRSDGWRSFSVAGFFTADVIEAVRAVLRTGQGGEVRDLILRLLHGAPVVAALAPELEALLRDPAAGRSARGLAVQRLLEVGGDDLPGVLEALLDKGGADALKLACDLCAGDETLRGDEGRLVRLLRACAMFYEGEAFERSRDHDARLAMGRMLGTLDLAMVEGVLDRLTNGLVCTCGAEWAYECHCRDGISKVVAKVLDRYFTLSAPPRDLVRVWGWLRGLNFHHGSRLRDSVTVTALHEDHALRQGIQRHVLGDLRDRDAIHEAVVTQFRGSQGHAGLALLPDDQIDLADRAFATDNTSLWGYFIPVHDRFHQERRGPNPARAHFRDQARQKPEFMERWTRRNRAYADFWEKERDSGGHYARRWKKRQRAAKAANEASLIRDKDRIERGEHWGWLRHVAFTYLHKPEELEKRFGGRIDVSQTLRNGLRRHAGLVPSVPECALRTGREIVAVLYAGCVAEYRATGQLDAVSAPVLKALIVDGGGYDGVEEAERSAFETEVSRCALATDQDREHFLRDVVETQLPAGGYSAAWWLEEKPGFQPFRASLPLEWLARFPQATLEAQGLLFDLCAKYADRAALCALIEQRCAETSAAIGPFANGQDPWAFWFLRRFYFLTEGDPEGWAWFSARPDAIFAFEQSSGRRRDGPNTGWPDLTARKVAQVLDAFIEVWSAAAPLPSSGRTGSSRGETPYRSLSHFVWTIGRDDPDAAIPVLDALLGDRRFACLEAELRSQRASAVRQQALHDFHPPAPDAVVALLAGREIVTVAQMRAVLVEKLAEFQAELRGGDLGEIETFYDGGTRVSENVATRRIVSWLRPRLRALEFSDAVEHQLHGANRCDFTAAKVMDGRRRLLVTEVKGQWHRDLFHAAASQLHDRYMIHPEAERQGVYLVLWFGPDEAVAGRRRHGIGSAQALQAQVEAAVPPDLRGCISVVVLDLSRRDAGPRRRTSVDEIGISG